MVQALQLQIKGMTCAACAQASERAVKKLPGVEEAAVNFTTEKLLVKFENGKLTIDQIKTAVAKAGYEAVDDRETKEVAILIGGMTCAACAKTIERVVAKLSGVDSVSVNFATEKASIKYDPAALRLSEIKRAISKAGYTPLAIADAAAGPPREPAKDEHRAAKEREIQVLWTQFAVSAFFSLPLLYVAMGAMLGLPLPWAIRPMDYPLRYALLEIALVLPAIAAGYRFYVVGFKAIIRGSPNMDSLIAMGTSAAFLYSLYSVFQIGSGDLKAVESLYFETAGVIITLILLGKSLEAVTKGRTSESIKKLMGLAPKTATIVHDGAESEIPIDEVESGDVVMVRPGEKIPVDGEVAERPYRHRRIHDHAARASPWRRASGTRSSARASTRTEASPSGPPRSARIRCSPGSSSWSRTRRAPRPPSPRWPISSRASSCP